MLIQIIDKNAEQEVLSTLEQHQGKSTTRNMLLCRFAGHHVTPIDADTMIEHTRKALSDKHGRLLYASDGDVFVQWDGGAREVMQAVTALVGGYVVGQTGQAVPADFFQHYDFHAHGEDLRIECRKKLGLYKAAPAAPEPEPEPVKPTPLPPPPEVKIEARIDDKQRAVLRTQITIRKGRKLPTILIVEDQAFSRKVLLNALGKTYDCLAARNGAEAIALYVAHAPDIVFLDVELPDVDGHALAGLFRAEDPDAFVAMVTANNYIDDVTKAKANKVQGFIVKPYNKQKIYGCIEQFMQRKNRR